jgi:hypothetical protein
MVAESTVRNHVRERERQLGLIEHAFAYFGGVFRLLRYDILANAARKILRGYRWARS